jgi:hypothetical protein
VDFQDDSYPNGRIQHAFVTEWLTVATIEDEHLDDLHTVDLSNPEISV